MTSKRIIDWIAFLAAVLAMPGGAAVAVMGLIDVRGITGACLAVTGMTVICLSGTALHIIKVFESLPPEPPPCPTRGGAAGRSATRLDATHTVPMRWPPGSPRRSATAGPGSARAKGRFGGAMIPLVDRGTFPRTL